MIYPFEPQVSLLQRRTREARLRRDFDDHIVRMLDLRPIDFLDRHLRLRSIEPSCDGEREGRADLEGFLVDYGFHRHCGVDCAVVACIAESWYLRKDARTESSRRANRTPRTSTSAALIFKLVRPRRGADQRCGEETDDIEISKSMRLRSATSSTLRRSASWWKGTASGRRRRRKGNSG